MNEPRDHPVLDAGNEFPADLPAKFHAHAEDDPMPSHDFRAASVLDVRGLSIAAAHPSLPAAATGTPAPGAAGVSAVSLSLSPGEALALVGAADSGADTIALALAGLLHSPDRITAGSILFLGEELVGLSRRAHAHLLGTGIGYLPADAAAHLDPFRSIRGQLGAQFRKGLGLPARAAAERAVELLDQVGLDDAEAISQLHTAELSPAALHRVALAVALAREPALLILMGPQGHGIPALALRLAHERALALILVTDDVTAAAAGSDRVALVRGGRIAEQGSVAEVITSHLE